MSVNNISKDIILKKKAFKLMEEATKRGYWSTHSIVFNAKGAKTLIIQIEETKLYKSIPISRSRSDRRIKNEQTILKIIKDNPGIQKKGVHDKLKEESCMMCLRNLSYMMASLLKRELIVVKSVGKGKSDPTRQYYPVNILFANSDK